MRKIVEQYVNEWCYILQLNESIAAHRRYAFLIGTHLCFLVLLVCATLYLCADSVLDLPRMDAQEDRIRSAIIEEGIRTRTTVGEDMAASVRVLRTDMEEVRVEAFRRSESKTFADMTDAEILSIMSEALTEMETRKVEALELGREE